MTTVCRNSIKNSLFYNLVVVLVVSVLPSIVHGQGCTSSNMQYWCSATQTCITLGVGTCPTLDTVFIGPATIRRSTSASQGGGCRVLTPVTCGANLDTVSSQLTIGEVFTLVDKCALSCKGYALATANSNTGNTGTTAPSSSVNTIFIGPGTIKRISTTVNLATSSCRIMTSSLCGTATSLTTIGVAAFTLKENCALQCKGYTMITPSTTTQTSSSSIVTRGTIAGSTSSTSTGSSSSTGANTSVFGSQQNSQIMNQNRPYGRRQEDQEQEPKRSLRGSHSIAITNTNEKKNQEEEHDATTPLFREDNEKEDETIMMAIRMQE